MWSDELQEETKEYFKSMPVAAMKQIGGRFGICTFEDGKYTVTDRESDWVDVFQCVEDLLNDGWTID